MIDAIIRRHLSEPGLPLNGALRGVVDVGETAIVSVEVFYRFTDDPDMQWQFAGYGRPGENFVHETDNYKREIEYSVIGVTSKGVRHVTDLNEGTRQTYTPTALDKTVATGIFSLFRHPFLGQVYNSGVQEVVSDGAGRYYSYLMPAGTLLDGESMILEYHGNLQSISPGGQKIHFPTFSDGTGDYTLGGLNTTEDGSLRVNITIQRHGTELRFNSQYVFDAIGPDDFPGQTFYYTGIDCDTTDLEFKYIVQDEASGDSSMQTGLGYKLPAPFEDDDLDYLRGVDGSILFMSPSVPLRME
jgi:hypothetical protein